MTQFPEAQDGQPLLTALFCEGHMRFHWCDTSSPLLHGYKMRGLVKYNVCVVLELRGQWPVGYVPGSMQAQQTVMRGYMDVQVDDGRIRDWKLLYGALKGDKIMLWRDELDEVCIV